MNNFELFCDFLNKYLESHNLSIPYMTTLKEASLNDSSGNDEYLYDGKNHLNVISMDTIAKDGYKLIKSTDLKEHPINTADVLLINRDNEWFLIEFKDCKISGIKQSVKDNIIKKAYSNWYMLMEMIYSMKEKGENCSLFNFDNPVKFAKDHVTFILVNSSEKDPNTYMQVKNHVLIGEKYTPPVMQRLKDYLFKDAYMYTEDFFERDFVDGFVY